MSSIYNLSNPIFDRFGTYILIDPRNNEPFYVGKGLPTRPYTHWHESHTNSAKDRKIRKMKNLGFSMYIVEWYITNTSEDWAFYHEKELIKKFGRLDTGTGILCNLTDGGDGTVGLIVTNETRIKHSIASKGNRNSCFGKFGNEHPAFGYKKTKEQIEKSKRIGSDNWAFGIETQDHPNFGSKRTPEQKQRMSDARADQSGENNSMFGKNHSIEARLTISKHRTGTKRCHNPETKHNSYYSDEIPEGYFPGWIKKELLN